MASLRFGRRAALDGNWIRRCYAISPSAQTEHLVASTCMADAAGIDAYEALIVDVIEGDHSLFLRVDEVNWAWQVDDPVRPRAQLWATERDYIQTYPAGNWGPSEATRLFDRDDQDWRNVLDA